MKTRVVRVFNIANAAYIYWVQKWSLWDPPDLLAAYPNKYDWRYVRPYPDEATAIATAKRFAEYGRDPMGADIGDRSGDVIAEFGG